MNAKPKMELNISIFVQNHCQSFGYMLWYIPFINRKNAVIPKIMVISKMLSLKLWQMTQSVQLKELVNNIYTFNFKILQRFEPYADITFAC